MHCKNLYFLFSMSFIPLQCTGKDNKLGLTKVSYKNIQGQSLEKLASVQDVKKFSEYNQTTKSLNEGFSLNVNSNSHYTKEISIIDNNNRNISFSTHCEGSALISDGEIIKCIPSNNTNEYLYDSISTSGCSSKADGASLIFSPVCSEFQKCKGEAKFFNGRPIACIDPSQLEEANLQLACYNQTIVNANSNITFIKNQVCPEDRPYKAAPEIFFLPGNSTVEGGFVKVDNKTAEAVHSIPTLMSACTSTWLPQGSFGDKYCEVDKMCMGGINEDYCVVSSESISSLCTDNNLNGQFNVISSNCVASSPYCRSNIIKIPADSNTLPICISSNNNYKTEICRNVFNNFSNLTKIFTQCTDPEFLDSYFSSGCREYSSDDIYQTLIPSSACRPGQYCNGQKKEIYMLKNTDNSIIISESCIGYSDYSKLLFNEEYNGCQTLYNNRNSYFNQFIQDTTICGTNQYCNGNIVPIPFEGNTINTCVKGIKTIFTTTIGGIIIGYDIAIFLSVFTLLYSMHKMKSLQNLFTLSYKNMYNILIDGKKGAFYNIKQDKEYKKLAREIKKQEQLQESEEPIDLSASDQHIYGKKIEEMKKTLHKIVDRKYKDMKIEASLNVSWHFSIIIQIICYIIAIGIISYDCTETSKIGHGITCDKLYGYKSTTETQNISTSLIILLGIASADVIIKTVSLVSSAWGNVLPASTAKMVTAAKWYGGIYTFYLIIGTIQLILSSYAPSKIWNII